MKLWEYYVVDVDRTVEEFKGRVSSVWIVKCGVHCTAAFLCCHTAVFCLTSYAPTRPVLWLCSKPLDL